MEDLTLLRQRGFSDEFIKAIQKSNAPESPQLIIDLMDIENITFHSPDSNELILEKMEDSQYYLIVNPH